MGKTFYKATRPDGTDFFSGTIDYAAAVGGKCVSVPSRPSMDGYVCCSDGVLHASDVAAETLAGGSWPCRLFEVTGRPVAREGHKYGFRSLRVVREIDATLALGPQGKRVAALVERAGRLTPTEATSLAGHAARYADRRVAEFAACSAARYAAEIAACSAAGYAAGYAAEFAAWDAAGWVAGNVVRYAVREAASDAAGGLLARDLVGAGAFTQAHYDTLTGPWRAVIGSAHEDD